MSGSVAEEQYRRAAKAVCAHSMSGFCANVGGDLGCKVGRGHSPSPDLCVASDFQLEAAGHWRAAAAAIQTVSTTPQPKDKRSAG